MIEYREIPEKIRQAEAVLIGASNGLSITEGLHLFAEDQAFETLFGDLKKKYGLCCILQGMGPAGHRKKKSGDSGAAWFIIIMAAIRRLR